MIPTLLIHIFNLTLQHTSRILFLSYSTHEALSIDLEASLNDDTVSVSLNLDSIFSEDFTYFEIIGSCRGFILFCSDSSIYLWNPSTRHHTQIPLSPFGPDLYDADYFYGFGYDESTQDYLLVSLSLHDSEDPPLHLKYFSLKSNTWKQVEGPHFRFTSQDDEPRGGCLYNGAIHWLAYRYDFQRYVIVAFDLMERKLPYMLLPNGFDENPFQCGLWVYGEFLSVYTLNYTNDTIEIWVMKEYKLNSSWTITLVLPTGDIKYSCRPLCCTKSGDIIGTDDCSGLFKSDKNGQLLEQHSFSNYDFRCKVTMYIESMLSLPNDGDNQQA